MSSWQGNTTGIHASEHPTMQGLLRLSGPKTEALARRCIERNAADADEAAALIEMLFAPVTSPDDNRKRNR